MPQRFPVFVLALCFSASLGCTERHENEISGFQDLRIAFLHTSDLHSRLLPYRMQVTYTDEHLGLLQENEPFGGIARIGHIINRERAKGGRTLYLDSGDVFQGAPIFNIFKGEAEFRALSYLNPDSVVVGNHEFDLGLDNLIKQVKENISFPMVAANYYFMPDNELGQYIFPYNILNVDGIKIGVIGLGDFGSLSSITDIGNSLKMMAMDNEQTVEDYVNILRPYVDLVVLLSHAGLSDDTEIAEASRGVDIIFGGHLHIVLNPPKFVRNLDGDEVLLVHSGAFAKYVGRLDIVAQWVEDPEGNRVDGDGTRYRLKLASHDYTLFPVDSTVPEDPELAELMEDYRLKLNQALDLTSVYGYSPKLLTKYGYEGGDSSLGNLVSEAIRRYARVDTAFTNTLGIRANMYPGPITLDDLFNIFPFENTITLLYMSGTDLRSLLDYNTRRSSGRGCMSQLQVAGLEFVMNCNPDPPLAFFECHTCEAGEPCLVNCIEACGGKVSCHDTCVVEYRECVLSRTGKHEDALCLDTCLPSAGTPYVTAMDEEVQWCLKDCFPRAEEIGFTDCPDPMAVEDISTCKKTLMQDDQIYEVATNDYIAMGGSGFTILKSNNTQQDTGLPLREAVVEVILTSGQCLEYCLDRDGALDLADCSVFQDCIAQVDEFYGHFCDHVDKTLVDAAPAGTPRGCSVDTGACIKDADCYYPEFDCSLEGVCKECNTSAECLGEDPDSLCVDGYCVKKTHVCVEGRCVIACDVDSDCPRRGGDAEHVCVRGRCAPTVASSCFSDDECTDSQVLCFGNGPLCEEDKDCGPGLVCRSSTCMPGRPACLTDVNCAPGQGCVFGRCTPNKIPCVSAANCGPGGECVAGLCTLPCGNCRNEADCPAGLACLKGLCITPLARCLDYRCRAKCATDAECKSGEGCTKEGFCVPRHCQVDLTSEKTCRLNALWDAHEKCANVPCVDSRVDGRIGRILPANLGQLEFGFVPENPEDIDYE